MSSGRFKERLMESNSQSNPAKKRLWTGRIMTGFAALFLFADGVAKLFKPGPVVEGTVTLGYPESAIVPVGIVLVTCTLLYAFPRTSVLGAVLLTGYLGGAVATHVRVGDPLFSHVLFPVYIGILIWGGVYLRDNRLAELVPLRSRY
jgi:DoxX-like family